MTESAGTLFVDVRADTKGFARDLREKLAAETKNVNAEVGVKVNSKGLRKNLRDAVTKSATGLHADVGMNVDDKGLHTKLQIAAREASRNVDAKIGVDLDQKTYGRRLRDFLRGTRRQTERNPIKIPVEPDESSLKTVKDFAQRIRDVFAIGSLISIGVKVVGIPAAVGALNSVASALIAITAAAAPAVEVVAGLVPVVVGVAAGFTTVKLATSGVGDAFKTIAKNQDAMAASGKLTTAQQQKLAAQLKDLAPAARDFVIGLTGMKSQFDKLRQTVQQRFFAPFAKETVDLAQTYIPLLNTRLGELASSFGRSLEGASQALRRSDVRNQLDNILGQTNITTAQLVSNSGLIVRAFAALGNAAAPLVKYWGNFLDSVLKDGAKMIIAAGQAGTLRQALIDAEGTFERVLRIIFNFGAGIANVFKAASSAGRPLLQSLANISAAFRDFTGSIEGQQALGSFFQVALLALSPLAALLRTLGSSLAALNKPLTDLAGSLATALVPIIPILGQGIEILAGAITSIAPAAGRLATALGGALLAAMQALAPILPTLADAISQFGVVLSDSLIQAVEAVAPLLPDLAKSLAELVISITPLVPLIVNFSIPLLKLSGAVLPPLISIIATTIGLFTRWGGALKIIGTVLGIAAAALVGLVAVIAIVGAAMSFPITATVLFIGALVLLYKRVGFIHDAVNAVAGAIGGALVAAFNAVVGAGKAVIGFFASIGSALAGAASAVGGFFSKIPAYASAAFSAMVGFFQQLPGQILGFLSSIGSSIGSFFAALPGRVAGAIQAFGSFLINQFAFAVGYAIGFLISLPARVYTILAQVPPMAQRALFRLAVVLVGVATSAWNAFAVAVNRGVRAAISFMASLPGRAAAAIQSLGSRLSSIARSAWNAVGVAVNRGVAAAVAFARALPGRAASAISSLGGRLVSIASSALSRMGSAISSGISSAVSFLRSLPGRAVAAVGNLGSVLYSAGIDLLEGLARGIGAAVGRVVGAAKQAASNVISGIKSGLGLGSPSKIAHQYGIWLLEGLENGIKRRAQAAISIAGKVATGVTRALAGVGTPTLGPLGITGVTPSGANVSALVQRMSLESLGGGFVSRQVGPSGNTINVFPQPGQDEREIARNVDKRLAATVA